VFRSRLVRSALLISALLVLVAPTAQAHRTSSFRACVVDGGACRWRGDVLADGTTARLVGMPHPAHVGHPVRVWRRDPRDGVWRKVDTTVVRRWGNIRWAWTVHAFDARTDPYRIRFQIPGHGTSSTARLHVITPDF